MSKIALLGNETEFSNVASLSSDAPDLSLAEVVGSKSASSSNIAAQNSEIPLQQSGTTIGEKVISTSLVLYIKEQYIEFHLRRMSLILGSIRLLMVLLLQITWFLTVTILVNLVLLLETGVTI